MTDNEIYRHAIAAFGADMQECVAIEECAELIQAITHKHRCRTHNIAEEIADVEIMLAQLKIINGCASEVDAIHEEKVKRLYDRICDELL